MSALHASISWASARYSSFLRVCNCWLAYFSICCFFDSTSSSSRLRSASICLARVLRVSSWLWVAAALARRVSRSGLRWASSPCTRRIFRSRSCKSSSFSIVSSIVGHRLAAGASQVNSGERFQYRDGRPALKQNKNPPNHDERINSFGQMRPGPYPFCGLNHKSKGERFPVRLSGFEI